MWPNPQFPADLVTLLKKSLMENFIFSAVRAAWRFLHFKFLRNDFSYLRTKVGDAFTTMIYSTQIWYSKVRLVTKTEGVTSIPSKNSPCNGRRKDLFKHLHLNRQSDAFLF